MKKELNKETIGSVHYSNEAKKHGKLSSSTMEDDIVRQREEDNILAFVEHFGKNKKLKILDIGCGNGYMLSILEKLYPLHEYFGVDYSKDMITICRERDLDYCSFEVGDAGALDSSDDFFDLVFTERCLINVLDAERQKQCLNEIHRVLKPKGHYLCIECFTDGLENNNKARVECGLEPLSPVAHNLYFKKSEFLEFIKDKFVVLPNKMQSGNFVFHQNFLSSHYFISRVLHALVTKGPHTKNSEFVKFFSFLPPIGNYAQIQAFILQKTCK